MLKALKIYLEKEGLFQNTPRESFKVAFKIGWVKDETGFLLIIEDRNKTSHIYSKQQSEEIFKRIQTQHIGNISSLIDVLKNKLASVFL
jgi:nucleotidyltransferase substrate binding protein (TIGR01987 family)